MATAPIIGGALTSTLTWRWCFFINLPTAAAPAVMILMLKLPKMALGNNKKSQIEKLRELDLLGCLFFAPAVLCLLLALQWGGSTYSWSNARIIVLLVLASLIFGGFCLIQHVKQDRAMLPPRIIKKGVMLFGALFSLSLSACRATVQHYVRSSSQYLCMCADKIFSLQSGSRQYVESRRYSLASTHYLWLLLFSSPLLFQVASCPRLGYTPRLCFPRVV